MKYVALLFSLLVTAGLSAQGKMMVVNGDTFYIIEPSKGDKLLEKGDTKGALAAYRKEFKKDPQGTAYNFACAFARNNQPDSAFRYLFYQARTDTFNSGAFCLSDPDFIPLRTDKRWSELKDTIVANFTKHNPGRIKNMPLALKLWDMLAWDQAYYTEIFQAEKKMGRESSVVTALWHLKELLNQRNRQELDSIIGVNGWPKISDVGNMASSAAFLIVQHSTLELQQQYLPVIRSLCEQGEANWQSYALMYDRVQVRQEKPQLYGSQLRYNETTKEMEFFPIEDEANVNKRRAEMGLGPIEDYAKSFGVKYEPKK